jgi:hypothetical protein
MKMLEDQMRRTPREPDPSLAARRVLDTAVGILVGLRHCRVDAAFRELIDAAKRHDIAVFAIASALVDLASGVSGPRRGDAADRAAFVEWDELARCQISAPSGV